MALLLARGQLEPPAGDGALGVVDGPGPCTGAGRDLNRQLNENRRRHLGE